MVEPRWLSERLQDATVVPVDVRPPHFYAQGHVPGAVNLPGFFLSAPTGGPPAPQDIARRLGALGIGRDTHVVAYDDGASSVAARLLWVLHYLRHRRVSILNGGVTRWRHNGYDWEYQAVSPAAVTYRVGSPDEMVIVSKEQVAAAIGDPDTIIIDTRSPGEYLGHQRSAEKDGHVPTAVNVDWTNNLQRDEHSVTLMQTEEALRTLYWAASVTPDKKVIVYCQSGGRSSQTYATLMHLGYEHVANYAYGWQEWGNDPGAPVEMQ